MIKEDKIQIALGIKVKCSYCPRVMPRKEAYEWGEEIAAGKFECEKCFRRNILADFEIRLGKRIKEEKEERMKSVNN